jgi:SSS family solute:Na+ symporter
MAVATIFIYILLLGSVTYSGALTIRTVAREMGYNVPLQYGSLVIGLIAMAYVAFGGLKACAWADLIQGSALIVGGAVIMICAFNVLGKADEASTITNVSTGAVEVVQLDEAAGPVERFWNLNKVRMNMFLPADDPVLPWTALLLGLWIPNFYYWGLNQYITQRTLGSASLSQGQQGIVFAAFLKLFIPFVIVIPGIIAFNLFAGDMQQEAVVDNSKVLAKYLKANPETKYVEAAVAPDAEGVKNWAGGRFMLALYPTEMALRDMKVRNPFVLPMVAADYDALEVGKYAVFKTEDKAVQSLMPGLADEVKAYDEKVDAAASAAGAKTTTEKFIAYKYDTALGQLLAKVLPQGNGVVGFVLAALLGAVVSSLAAMLNAASTIFTMDIFRKYIKPEASQSLTVMIGRLSVVACSVVAVLLAPQLGNPKISNSIFTIIQESQGFISPGILAVFVFGLVMRKAPPVSGVVGLVTSIVAYGAMKVAVPGVQFLNRMAVCFILCLVVMTLITAVKPLPQPVEFKQQTTIDLRSSKGALVGGIVVVVITLIFYVLFSPIGLVG